MNHAAIEDYFEALDWFDSKYSKGNGEVVLKQMFQHWPVTTLRLLDQGFFMALLLRN